MGRKVTTRKRSRRDEEEAIVEDLDLDIDDRTTINFTEDDVVHNRKRGTKTPRSAADEDGHHLVLPSDAHRLDGYGDDEHGDFAEEEELAQATWKSLRKRVTEDDYAVAGVSLDAVKTAAAKKKAASAASADPTMAAIETVERDFAALSTKERLEIFKKESPELLKMLDDLKKYFAEVKELATPLHELLYERKVPEEHKNMVSFLETKVQLLLSYCMHVTFYLLLKAEGKKVAGHPVVDNLVQIRVYLEKMWPLEEKLQYSLNRLLSGKESAAAHLDDLRPVSENAVGTYQATRTTENTEARERRRQLRDQQEAEELEREEQSAMMRVRAKRATALNLLGATVAPLSYQEDEDQYFAKLTGGVVGDDDEDEGGMSLMDALRKHQRTVEGLRRSTESKKEAVVYEDSDDEPDMLGSDGDFDGENAEDTAEDGSADEAEYNALWDEEAGRKQAAAEEKALPRRKFITEEVDRRKVGKRIESHRGLTKARPKDRKNPRVAQRRKYERGMQRHKAQSREFQPEPEGGFVGVRSLKPGVVRSRAIR